MSRHRVRSPCQGPTSQWLML